MPLRRQERMEHAGVLQRERLAFAQAGPALAKSSAGGFGYSTWELARAHALVQRKPGCVSERVLFT